jgi:hypothetical protein
MEAWKEARMEAQMEAWTEAWMEAFHLYLWSSSGSLSPPWAASSYVGSCGSAPKLSCFFPFQALFYSTFWSLFFFGEGQKKETELNLPQIGEAIFLFL